MAIDPRSLLRSMFDAAVGAALPSKCLASHLPPQPQGRTIVVGAGKAGGAMAKRSKIIGRVRSKVWWSRAMATGAVPADRGG